MKKANYIVFDCETGGLYPTENPITQIALVTLDGKTLKELDRYETFIRPYNDLRIDKKALSITGLDMSEINAGLRYEQSIKMLIAYFKKAKPGTHPSLKPVLVGHNVQFDTGFVDYLFSLKNDSLWKYVSPTTADTMLLTKMFNPNAATLKLGDACAEVGIDLPDAHKAMNDVVATADLFRVYVNKLRNATGGGITTKTKEKLRVKFQF